MSKHQINHYDKRGYFRETFKNNFFQNKKFIFWCMSKSKKNTIDPEKIIENYGADAVRLFMLSDSPPEKDVQWSEQGMVSSFKFVQKLWILHSKIKKKLSNKNDLKELKGMKRIFEKRLFIK